MPSEEELYKMWWIVPVGTPVMVKVAYNAVLQTRTASAPALENGVAFIYLIQEESKEKFMLKNVRLHDDKRPFAPFEMSMLLSARDRRTALFLALKCLAHATLEDHPKNLEMEFEGVGEMKIFMRESDNNQGEYERKLEQWKERQRTLGQLPDLK